MNLDDPVVVLHGGPLDGEARVVPGRTYLTDYRLAWPCMVYRRSGLVDLKGRLVMDYQGAG